MADKPYKIHPNSLANLHHRGRPKGSKSRVTLTRQIYDGTLYELAKSRLPDVMKQIVEDAMDSNPKIRQKAQQMLMQAMQANAQREEGKEDKDKSLDIQIRRDGVLIQQGQNSLTIEGGVVSRQAGGDDGVVPYNPYTSTTSQKIQANDPSYQTNRGKNLIDGVLCAPRTQIPYEQFVGPLPEVYRNYGDSVSFDEEYQLENRKLRSVEWWDRPYEERYARDDELDELVSYDDLPLEPLPREVEETVGRARMLFEILPDEDDGVEESED